jgi:hypothetical protein
LPMYRRTGDIFATGVADTCREFFAGAVDTQSKRNPVKIKLFDEKMTKD